MKKLFIAISTPILLIGCNQKPDLSRYIGVAEKVDIIHTEDLDSSLRHINYYDIWINGSVMRIRTGCFKGQKVYRGTFNISEKGSDYRKQELIFCHGSVDAKQTSMSGK